MDMYEDKNPPKWPHNGVPFNRWFRELHAFIYALQYDFSWAKNPVGWKAKYLNIRLDTRNGNFLVFCENPETQKMDLQITPDDLGLDHKPFPFVYGKMQNMKDAPKDRKILIRLGPSYGKNEFAIAEYTEWDSTGPYQKVWEVAPGQCFRLNDPDLLGWWNLPNETK